MEGLNMQELTNYFKGLADSNRLRILNLLLPGKGRLLGEVAPLACRL